MCADVLTLIDLDDRVTANDDLVAELARRIAALERGGGIERPTSVAAVLASDDLPAAPPKQHEKLKPASW